MKKAFYLDLSVVDDPVFCAIIDLIIETSLKCKKVTPEICLGPFQRLVTLSFVGGIHKLR